MARKKTALKGFMQDIEAARVESGRNTLAAWFRAHHDELLVELAGRPIEWDLYLAVFAKRGLKDANGNTPTRNTASKTWHRVQSGIAADQARKQARTSAVPALAVDEIAPGVRHLEPATAGQNAATPEPARPRLKLDIRPSRPLMDAPPQDQAASKPPAPQAEAARLVDAQEQIRRTLDALDSKRTPMPRIVR